MESKFKALGKDVDTKYARLLDSEVIQIFYRKVLCLLTWNIRITAGCHGWRIRSGSGGSYVNWLGKSLTIYLIMNNWIKNTNNIITFCKNINEKNNLRKNQNSKQLMNLDLYCNTHSFCALKWRKNIHVLIIIYCVTIVYKN